MVLKFKAIQSFSSSKCLVHMKLLWIGSVSQLFAVKISGLVMCCFNSVKRWCIFTTRSAFSFFQKDVFTLLQQSMMVYKFQCQFNADYIGRTTQTLEVEQYVLWELHRWSQETTSRSSQAQELAIGDHLGKNYTCWMKYSDEHLSVLYKARCMTHLVIFEAIAITLFHPSLCK